MKSGQIPTLLGLYTNNGCVATPGIGKISSTRIIDLQELE
ncbi:MAG: hypothetical protein A4E36_00619 [Methanoregulaceae archaeon PtaB.Bin009]|nr:MAG: hypothetical protein A4E36_00619 [Methanoregulaceae archaeon PtaB.Bin009]